MPTPERTNVDAIVTAATEILEHQGVDALTMQAVATAVGVRAPSLYKRVRSRNDVIRLVMERIAIDLGDALDAAVDGIRDPRDRALALLRATRAFAHARPDSYSLLFARLPDDALPEPAVLAGTIAGVLRVSTELVGDEHALEAARTLTAWVHGFVSMELADRFRMGRDVDEAFEYGSRRIADALAMTAR
jgi:AcrR family transcriptional regulator